MCDRYPDCNPDHNSYDDSDRDPNGYSDRNPNHHSDEYPNDNKHADQHPYLSADHKHRHSDTHSDPDFYGDLDTCASAGDRTPRWW